MITMLSLLLLLLPLLFTGAAGGAGTVKKQLRWYSGSPERIADLLLGDNPRGLLNTTEKVSDITGGVYLCCNHPFIESDGTLEKLYAAKNNTLWNITQWTSLDMYATLALARNCSDKGTPKGCWSMGDSCNAALARVDDFTASILDLMVRNDLKGVNLDWESGWGNNVTCHKELWGKATKTFRKHGKVRKVA